MSAGTAMARPKRRQVAISRRGGGWRVIAAKELADHLLSVRLYVLLVILALAAGATVYFASAAISQSSQTIRENLNQLFVPPTGFLLMFTVADQNTFQFPFYGLVGFVLPLIGIAFGFDSVNGERAAGTLPRLVAQPIHRDDVINGKFAAGLFVIALLVAVMTAIVAGMGILRLGITPAPSDVVRLVAFVVVSTVYAGFWLAFAMLCSVLMRRAASSALVAFGVWLAFSLFFGFLASLLAGALSPAPADATTSQALSNAQLNEAIARISPVTLYQEAVVAILDPLERSVGVFLSSQAQGAVPSTLSVDQSIFLVWPQVVALIAGTVVVFAVAYVVFMRQEVRA